MFNVAEEVWLRGQRSYLLFSLSALIRSSRSSSKNKIKSRNCNCTNPQRRQSGRMIQEGAGPAPKVIGGTMGAWLSGSASPAGDADRSAGRPGGASYTSPPPSACWVSLWERKNQVKSGAAAAAAPDSGAMTLKEGQLRGGSGLMM